MDADIYKEKFKQLLLYCHHKGYKIRLVSKDILHDYAGMNWWAARSMGFPFKNKDVIYIAKDMSWKDRYEILRYEIDEIIMMKKGMKYCPAHKKALQDERRLSIPNKKTHINNHKNHSILMEVRY